MPSDLCHILIRLIYNHLIISRINVFFTLANVRAVAEDEEPVVPGDDAADGLAGGQPGRGPVPLGQGPPAYPPPGMQIYEL